MDIKYLRDNIVATIFIAWIYLDVIHATCSKPITLEAGTKHFLNEIFKKYGKIENGKSITKKELSEFMAALKVGDVRTYCEENDSDCVLHKHGDYRRKRNLPDAYNSSQHLAHWNSHVDNCLKVDKLLSLHKINDSLITRDDFLAICPALVQQVDSQQCVHYHRKRVIDTGHDDAPERSQVWMYGFISITAISLLSLAVIAMIPCLKKTFYYKVMAYLVALAVGTLSGDAMLHLIPHAFAEGANAATQMELTDEMKLKQHYSQVWRALFVLLGIYLFFLVEQIMKLKLFCKGGHGHSHGKHGHAVPSADEEMPSSPPPDEDKPMVVFDGKDVILESTDGNMQNCHNDEHLESGPYHADDRHHHHHHSEKTITKETKIASLAWMVIVGDGFHNFSDGLAVGAAYSASISSGLSTTIAVFCHELPHELGDFAILIQSGMTIKQAIIYNLVSAVLAYFGLIVGILIGGYEIGRHFILSITAGLFLYVSLADMMPELNNQEVPKQSKCSAFFCQNLGILSGIAIMLFISLFEHVM